MSWAHERVHSAHQLLSGTSIKPLLQWLVFDGWLSDNLSYMESRALQHVIDSLINSL